MKIVEKVKENKHIRAKINTAIDRRCKRINKELRKILASILDKPYNKIKINCILKYKEDNCILYNELNAVLEQIRKHFSKQFKQKNIINNNRVIKEFYKLFKKIKED